MLASRAVSERLLRAAARDVLEREESGREPMCATAGVCWRASGVALVFGGDGTGPGGAIVAAERVGRRRRVGAKDFVCL